MPITGTRGIAHIDFVNAGLSYWREDGYLTPDVSHESRVRREMFGALKKELAYFTRCVPAKRPPKVVSLEDALHRLEVALAIVAAVESGSEVVLSN